ncbi:MAG TPA: FAD/NAD(P)-binding protein, partial [Sphingomicrobium sp.]|nr:FAD/NAD(P)-binding protein [Sphingomicrobium sp.]
MTSEAAASADVAIVGGGFSGTVAAAQLARRGISSLLIEGAGRLGRGIAYSTREPAHVINVHAEVMSAWPEDTQDFARQVEAEGGTAKDFVERARFGRYLDAILNAATSEGLVTPIEAMAVSAARGEEGWIIDLADGRSLSARALLLAIGNQEPAPMAVAAGISSKRFINNPWGPEARAADERLAGGDRSVLLIGTGLTAVDHILSLGAGGHRGRITALSRRGQMPRGHIPYEPVPVELDELPMGNVLELWRWLRRRAAQGSWRAAVDALRPHSSAIWQAFGPKEQRRFLRHAWPWWSVHRHRIATAVAARMKELVGSGQLEIVAGRIRAMREVENGVEVEIVRRGSGKVETRMFDTVVNCTGPLGTMAKTQNQILKQMLGDELVAVDPLGIGLEVDDRDRAGD